MKSIILVLMLSVGMAHAQDTKVGKKVDVDNLKKKYWAGSTDLEVVQNRAYSKKGRIGIDLLGGTMISDPFLTTYSLGLEIGYHFNEYLSFHLIAWKDFASDSDASDVLLARNVIANTNPRSGYYGGEVAWSFIYGKLSLLGSSILYYDLFLLGGLGLTTTETGDNFTPHLGIGQRIFLTQWMSLRVDYRLMYYNEKIINKDPSDGAVGEFKFNRSNFTNAITLGLELLL